MKKKGLSQKQAQATALAVTFVLSVFSVAYYAYKDYFSFTDAFIYVPFGIVGAFAGSFLLSKFSDRILKKLFALFIIWAGARMLLR